MPAARLLHRGSDGRADPEGEHHALAYTGSILGAEFAVARFLLCLVFGIGIGLLMALLFWRDDASHDAQTDTLFADKASVAPAALGVLLSLVALLIAGTLKLWPLTATVGAADLPLPWAQAWQDTLFRWVPFDEAKGEEGVSVQGSLLILLLVVGVFVVGIVRELIRPEWIQALAGRNDLTANAVAVVFGVFMYFPTLVEVPVARMFLDLGMHPGPLLAYLMADPELSLQSILMVAAVIGRPKAFAYGGLVAVFSIVAGHLYGAWVDGAGLGRLALGMLAFIAVLGAVLGGLHRRRQSALRTS